MPYADREAQKEYQRKWMSDQEHRPRFCKRGHEFTAANTYVKPSRGTRECLRCKRDRAAGRLAA